MIRSQWQDPESDSVLVFVGVILDNRPCQLNARAHVEFPKYLPKVVVDRVGGQEETGRNFGVGQPLSDMLGHCLFRTGETCPCRSWHGRSGA